MQETQGESVFEHQVYSDGLASVSVYVENRKEGTGSVQGASKIGTANAFSRNIGSKQVTVSGEVPTITVLSIGNAVAPPDSSR
jgi:sigma-E factor negative regulatory protein RseB